MKMKNVQQSLKIQVKRGRKWKTLFGAVNIGQAEKWIRRNPNTKSRMVYTSVTEYN